MAEEMKEETKKEEATKKETKIDDKRIFGILSYLSILCLIPLFVKKDDEFVYFHAKQGLVLFIAEIAWYVLFRIIFGMFWGSIFIWGLLGLINNLVNLGFLVLAIIGIINVIQDKKKELPLIGKYAEKIKI